MKFTSTIVILKRMIWAFFGGPIVLRHANNSGQFLMSNQSMKITRPPTSIVPESSHQSRRLIIHKGNSSNRNKNGQNIYRSPLQETKKGSRRSQKRRTCWKSVSVSKRQRIKRTTSKRTRKGKAINCRFFFAAKPIGFIMFPKPSKSW